MIEFIENILSSIPNTVWAAIIASCLTIGGVLLTNRGNDKRLLAQLSHDAEQRKNESLMALRKNVYLPAIEAVSNNYLMLSKMSNLDLTENEISNIFSISAASTSKINLIGTTETVKSVSTLSSILASTYLKLTAKRIKLIEKRDDIEILNNLINDSSKEKDRLLELMKEFNLQGSNDKRRWDVINDRYEYETKQTDKYISERDILSSENEIAIKAYAMECYKSLKAIGKPITEAIAAIRKEMDIPFDNEEYQKIMDESFTSGEVSLDEFFEEIKQQNG